MTTSIPTFSPLTDWSALTYDDFEERKENPTHSHQGIYSARIKGNNTGSQASFFHHSNHNATLFAMLRICFWFKALCFDNNETFFLEYSSDGGLNWVMRIKQLRLTIRLESDSGVMQTKRKKIFILMN